MIRRWCSRHGALAVLLGILATAHLVIEGLIRFVQEIGRQLGDPAMANSIVPARTSIPTVAALCVVAYRILAHHPLFDRDYRLWLERTPWTPAKSLPMGGIQPQWTDLAWVACLCCLSFGGPIEMMFAPAIAYLAAFSALAGFVALTLRQRAVLFTLLFAAGLAIRLTPTVVGPYFVLLAVWPVAILGLRQSLDPNCWPALEIREKPTGLKGETQPTHLGWPFGLLSPEVPPRQLTRVDSAAISLLVGWFAYSILSVASAVTHEEKKTVVLIAGLVLLIGTIAWLLTYVVGRVPPISLLGRIATGHWIVPSYDRILLPPLLALSVFTIGETVILAFQMSLQFAQPVVFTTCVFLFSGLGPTLSNWELTGGHRITPIGRVNTAGGFLKV